MNQKQILHDIDLLPPTAQQEVIDFIAFLQERYAQPPKSKETLRGLKNELFIGLWHDRSDIKDSRSWVRVLRTREWG